MVIWQAMKGHYQNPKRVWNHRDLKHQHFTESTEEVIGRVLELQCPSLASIRHWISYQESSTRSTEPLPVQLILGITYRQVQRMAVARFNALLGSRG